MEITKEIAAAWIERYEKLQSFYQYYLNKMDESDDTESSEMYEMYADQYGYEMRGMNETLAIFGYSYSRGEITKKD